MMHEIAAEIAALDRMTTGDLAERYAELHGQPCRTRHRAYLIRKVAWRIQANAEGDLSERSRKRAAELADDAEVRVMAPKTMICPPQHGESTTITRPVPTGQDKSADTRLTAPGSAIIREYKGRTIRAVVLENGKGFECDGERFRTLAGFAVVPLLHGSVGAGVLSTPSRLRTDGHQCGVQKPKMRVSESSDCGGIVAVFRCTCGTCATYCNVKAPVK